MPTKNPPVSGGVFHKLTVDEFHELLSKVTPARRIDAIHLHHTWRPRHVDFNGVDTIVGMWRFHTQTQGWSDIAQHLTIDPGGDVWTGRHWDMPPASAKGFNGSDTVGPFMIEMIGDFDTGRDPFVDPQRGAAVKVLALLLNRFTLGKDAIKFHNQMSDKTCPGSAIERAALLKEVEARRKTLSEPPAARGLSPFSSMDTESSVAKAFALLSSARAVGRSLGEIATDVAAAELPESATRPDAAETRVAVNALEVADVEGRDVDITFTPTIKEALKPYVVNLTRGKFSNSGEFTTTKEDVDRIFDEHLPEAVAQAPGGRLKIVVYAHGGLVGEKSGLGVALKHVHWWRADGVYPIYFVWETDLITSLINAIKNALDQDRGARGDFLDARIEELARRIKANSIWADMKHVADLASRPDGGARYVANRLGQFCADHAGNIEVHAIGHSAGANFHGFFVPVALDAGVPRIETMQFMAPAIAVSSFFTQLSPRLGSVGPVTMFTMKDSFERDDNCANVYEKSLLYLIHQCLEDVRETDLLGLEISVRRDLRLKRFFGLEGTPHPRGHQVVWSVTTGDRRSSSESTRHGGFDDDPATMNSVARRVLGLTGADDLPQEFVAPARSVDVDVWSEGATGIASAAAAPETFDAAVETVPAPGSERPATPGIRGRRKALCVGINVYKRKPLNGCVADARAWAATFREIGFDVQPLLLDTEATGDRIVSTLRALIAASARGDVIAFQFSGHGTTLPDTSGDEVGGDSSTQDEALCPYKLTSGRFIIDDELATVFDEAAQRGVHVTSFIDCCHSGSITRLGVGPVGGDAGGRADERPRFLAATPAEIQMHLRHRASRTFGAARSSVRSGQGQRDVLFSACRSVEVAWESNGQGDFTRLATPLLRQAGSITNATLLSRIRAAFGSNARQLPELHPPSAANAPLFAGIGGTSAAGASAAAGTAGFSGGGRTNGGDVAALLRAIADFLSN